MRETEGAPTAPEEREAPSRLVGQTIDGRYFVERVLGEGGMGVVYKAKHVHLGKTVAVKVLKPEVSRDEQILARFRQEAQSASAIGNPHIVDVIDFGTIEQRFAYFVMEYVEGIELSTVVARQQPLGIGRVVHLGKQLCEALAAAHAAGIVHRDLKPENIYVSRFGDEPEFVKVFDFGIAKVAGAADRLTSAGQVFGTPHYMSPEQASGQAVDHRSDVYQVGVILYEMVTGRTPFDGQNALAILSQHLNAPPRAPSRYRPDCPPMLEEVILRALAKDPSQRFESMHAFREALRRVQPTDPPGIGERRTASVETLSGLPEASTPVVSEPPLVVGGVLAKPTPGRSVAGSAAASRSRLALGLALGLLGVSGVAWGLAMRTESEQGPGRAGGPENASSSREAGADVGGTEAATFDSTPAFEPVARPDRALPVRLVLRSQPAGAEVRVEDRAYGATPVDVDLRLPGARPGQEVRVAFHKDGHRDVVVARPVPSRGALAIDVVLEPLVAGEGTERRARRPVGAAGPSRDPEFRRSPY